MLTLERKYAQAHLTLKRMIFPPGYFASLATRGGRCSQWSHLGRWVLLACRVGTQGWCQCPGQPPAPRITLTLLLVEEGLRKLALDLCCMKTSLYLLVIEMTPAKITKMSSLDIYGVGTDAAHLASPTQRSVGTWPVLSRSCSTMSCVGGWAELPFCPQTWLL